MGAKKAPSTEAETPLAFLLACATDATKERLRAELQADQEKLFLLLVRTLNPYQHLKNPEEGLLRGMAAKTVGKKKRGGEMPAEPGT